LDVALRPLLLQLAPAHELLGDPLRLLARHHPQGDPGVDDLLQGRRSVHAPTFVTSGPAGGGPAGGVGPRYQRGAAVPWDRPTATVRSVIPLRDNNPTTRRAYVTLG